jgi:oligoribonuclease NrnB/cAMP/cGMP phosphodiesterase (DHH superfamily)
MYSSIIITHKNCPDGAGSVIISKNIFTDIHAIFGEHTIIDEQVKEASNLLKENGTLILADMCSGKDTIHDLFPTFIKKNITLLIYEHHKSRDWLSDFSFPDGVNGEIIFDNDRCGTKILFDRYIHTHKDLNKYSDFVSVTNDRDLWLKQDPRSDMQATLHFVLGDEEYITRFMSNPEVALTHDETLLVNYQKHIDTKYINELLNTIIIKTDSAGFRYGVVYGEGHSSNLLNTAITRYGLEYGIHCNLNGKNVGLRSKGNFDCAKYAAERGGGGHKAAAGFPLQLDFPEF